MKPLEQLCCQNSCCAMYGQRGQGNLSVCGWIDKRHTIRQLYCSRCKARFSERKGTPLYNSKLSSEKVISTVFWGAIISAITYSFHHEMVTAQPLGREEALSGICLNSNAKYSRFTRNTR